MNSVEIQQAVNEGKTVFGTLITSSSPFMLKGLLGSPLDFVFFDTEHIPYDTERLSWMCMAYKLAGYMPLVRIPDPDPFKACQVLDGGAQGVVAAYIETVEQVNALRGAVKLRQLKGKRLDRVLEGGETLSPGLQKYLDDWNEGNLLFINIESKPALENLDALLDAPGVDGVLLGPHDLSLSLDIPEQYDHPRFVQAIKHIAQKAKEREQIAAAHFDGPTAVRAGYNMVILAADHSFTANGFAREKKKALEAIGQSESLADDPSTSKGPIT